MVKGAREADLNILFGKVMCLLIMNLGVQSTVSLPCLQHNDLSYFLMTLGCRFGNSRMGLGDGMI